MTKEKVHINLPDHADETASTIIGDRILFVSIHHDQDASNPLDDDGLGHIFSFNRRHRNCAVSSQHVDDLMADKDHVKLAYYEHGRCQWMVADESKAKFGGDWQWDGVDYAGIWVPDDSTRESYPDKGASLQAKARLVLDVLTKGQERHEWMKKQAAAACQVYTDYCNGDVYGYQIAVYELKRDGREPLEDKDDYEGEEAIEDDSCYGFIGWDHLKQEVIAQAQRMVGK